MRVPLLVALFVAGCGTKRVTPPPEKTLELAGKKAVWRAWARVDPCGVDPRLLATELSATNALLLEYLGATSGGFDGVWSDDQLATLDRSQKELPPALDALDHLRSVAPRCGFQRNVGEELQKLEELTRQSRNRLKEAPELLAYLAARRELDRWKESLVRLEEEARSQWCPAKPKVGNAELFFAFEDEKGRTEWRFCDGSKVFIVPGGTHELVPPEGKNVKPKKYLDEVSKWPPSEVRRAPKLPVRHKPAEPPEKEEEPTDEPV